MTNGVFIQSQDKLSMEAWRLSLRQKTDKEKFKEKQEKLLKEIYNDY
jgi:hypothetical protein